MMKKKRKFHEKKFKIKIFKRKEKLFPVFVLISSHR